MAKSIDNEARIMTLALNRRRTPQDKDEKPAVQKRLYTIEEAAIYLGRSPSAVRRLVSLGYLPSVRIGPKRLALDKVDLDKIIEAGKNWHLDR